MHMVRHQAGGEKTGFIREVVFNNLERMISEGGGKK